MSLRALLRRTKEGVATVLQLVLGVGDDKLWQALAGVVDDVDDAVVGAGPRLQGLVRAAVHAVKLLPEPCMRGPKACPFHTSEVLSGLPRSTLTRSRWKYLPVPLACLPSTSLDL